jgi:hypothetical protein
VNVKLCELDRGEPHKWGAPLIPQGFYLFHHSLFSLTLSAQRKKLCKKEMPKAVSPSADGDQHTRVGSAVAFLKKATQKLFTELAVESARQIKT